MLYFLVFFMLSRYIFDAAALNISLYDLSFIKTSVYLSNVFMSRVFLCIFLL